MGNQFDKKTIALECIFELDANYVNERSGSERVNE